MLVYPWCSKKFFYHREEFKVLIAITDTNISDCIIDLAYWSDATKKTLLNQTDRRVSTDELAKIKKLCREYLNIPLIQALSTDED